MSKQARAMSSLWKQSLRPGRVSTVRVNTFPDDGGCSGGGERNYLTKILRPCRISTARVNMFPSGRGDGEGRATQKRT